MRILIELTAEEAAAREKWLAEGDNINHADWYDILLWALAQAFHREVQVLAEAEKRVRAIAGPRPGVDVAPLTVCTGVDLVYAVPQRHLYAGQTLHSYRYTLAGHDRGDEEG